MFNPLPSPCHSRPSSRVKLSKEDLPFSSIDRDYSVKAQKMTLDSVLCSMSENPWIPESKEKLAGRLVQKKEYDPERGLEKIGQEEASAIEAHRRLVAEAATMDGYKAFHELTLKDLLASGTCRAYEFLMSDFFEESWNRKTEKPGVLEILNMSLEKLEGLHERQENGEELVDLPEELEGATESNEQQIQEVLPQVQRQEFGETVQEPMEVELPKRRPWKRIRIDEDAEETTGEDPAHHDGWVPRRKYYKIPVDSFSDDEEEENEEPVKSTEAETVQEPMETHRYKFLEGRQWKKIIIDEDTEETSGEEPEQDDIWVPRRKWAKIPVDSLSDDEEEEENEEPVEPTEAETSFQQSSSE